MMYKLNWFITQEDGIFKAKPEGSFKSDILSIYPEPKAESLEILKANLSYYTRQGVEAVDHYGNFLPNLEVHYYYDDCVISWFKAKFLVMRISLAILGLILLTILGLWIL